MAPQTLGGRIHQVYVANNPETMLGLPHVEENYHSADRRMTLCDKLTVASRKSHFLLDT